MKKMILTFFPIILLIFLFSGCSWQEYFQIVNETNSEITVEYKVEIPANGFAIFENKPSAYQLNSSNNIDWNKDLSIVDEDTSLLVVRLVLPPKSAVIFGSLSCDNYEKYNQYFINSRVFNLTNLSVNNNGSITEIIPENFDVFF